MAKLLHTTTTTTTTHHHAPLAHSRHDGHEASANGETPSRLFPEKNLRSSSASDMPAHARRWSRLRATHRDSINTVTAGQAAHTQPGFDSWRGSAVVPGTSRAPNGSRSRAKLVWRGWMETPASDEPAGDDEFLPEWRPFPRRHHRLRPARSGPMGATPFCLPQDAYADAYAHRWDTYYLGGGSRQSYAHTGCMGIGCMDR